MKKVYILEAYLTDPQTGLTKKFKTDVLNEYPMVDVLSLQHKILSHIYAIQGAAEMPEEVQ